MQHYQSCAPYATLMQSAELHSRKALPSLTRFLLALLHADACDTEPAQPLCALTMSLVAAACFMARSVQEVTLL